MIKILFIRETIDPLWAWKYSDPLSNITIINSISLASSPGIEQPFSSPVTPQVDSKSSQMELVQSKLRNKKKKQKT